MRYIWIWILIGIDVIWLISSIVDVVRTMKFVKNNRRYGSVGDFINCIGNELEDSTIGFILLHLFVLLAVSFFTWVVFETGG